MHQNQILNIKNDSPSIGLKEIPVLKYDVFYELVSDLLKDEAKHCLAYYGVESSGRPEVILLHCG